MRSTIRRAAAVTIIAGATLLSAPAAFAAGNDDYPAVLPTSESTTVPASIKPTVEGVSANAPALAYTGTDVAVWLTTGATLTAGGALLVLASRRKAARH